MKKLILSAIIGFVAFCSFGQVTLEHTYNLKSNPSRTFFEVETPKGNFYIYSENNSILVYEANHTLRLNLDVTTLNTNTFPSTKADIQKSKFLYTPDDKIYLILFQENTTNFPVHEIQNIVVDEQSNIIFKTDTITPKDRYSLQFITDNKLKLVSQYKENNTGLVKIYSFTPVPNGTSTTQNKPSINLKAYPNPSSTSETTISYELPASSTFGEMKIYNLKGIAVDTFKIGKHFNSIKVNTSTYTNGTYVCKVYANGTLISSEKLVVQK